MSFTPPFQKVLDEVNTMAANKEPIAVLQAFFKEKMIELGPKERLNNLYKIRPKRAVPGERSRYVSLRMNTVQDHYWDHRTNRDSVLKMRQIGLTTLSCIIGLDLCLFNYGSNACIMAHVLTNVKKYFRITKNAFTQFQKDWGTLYPVTNEVDNVSELHIAETGSIMMVATETKGLTLDFLHIAEAAFVPNSRIEESIESVPLSGHVVMESTPDGASGIFYEHWNNFLTSPDSSLFTCHFFPWWWHYPEIQDIPYLKRPKEFVPTEREEGLIDKYDLNPDHIIWRRNKISESGNNESEFLKKYPEDPITCFLSGAHSVFDADITRSLWMNGHDPAFKGDLRVANK